MFISSYEKIWIVGRRGKLAHAPISSL